MSGSKTCPKCGQSMEEGLLVDQGYGSFHQARWLAGPAERSLWTGLKVRGKTFHRVVSYRCTACGLLESYAVPPQQT